MVTYELLGSLVHTLILPDVGRQTVRGARELKVDYPLQFLGSSSLQNARHIAKNAPCKGCSEYKVTNWFKVKYQ